MSGRAWAVLLAVVGAIGFVTYLFAVQNSARLVTLSLDVGFAKWETTPAIPAPLLLGGAFGCGFLVALVLVLPRMAAQGRKVRALERQAALNAPASPQDPWR